MTTQSTPPPRLAPPDLLLARDACAGLAALLICVDPDAWATLARPAAPALGRLVGLIASRLDAGLDDLAA